MPINVEGHTIPNLCADANKSKSPKKRGDSEIKTGHRDSQRIKNSALNLQGTTAYSHLNHTYNVKINIGHTDSSELFTIKTISTLHPTSSLMRAKKLEIQKNLLKN